MPDPPPPPLPLDVRDLRYDLHLPGELAHAMAGRLLDADRLAVAEFLADGGLPHHGTELVDNPVTLVPLALHVGGPAVGARLGMTPDEPPEHVHAMARGPLATGGSVYDADLFDRALAWAGAPLGPGHRVLDFGCSSGRLLRVLHAARPDLELLGCDPNEAAIEWARDHIKGIDFFVSRTEPPLAEVGDASLDTVVALSIWSHFDRGPALRWLEEMHRIIRPGGHLAMTTHGWSSVHHYATRGDHNPEDQRPVAHELYRSGFYFYPTFGEHGDWGVRHEGWGQAFMTPDWLLAHASTGWSCRLFTPGALQGNQDVWVLRREP